jgi:hypothetical protein
MFSCRAVKMNLANEGFEARKKDEEVQTKKRKAENDQAWEGTILRLLGFAALPHISDQRVAKSGSVPGVISLRNRRRRRRRALISSGERLFSDIPSTACTCLIVAV